MRSRLGISLIALGLAGAAIAGADPAQASTALTCDLRCLALLGQATGATGHPGGDQFVINASIVLVEVTDDGIPSTATEHLFVDYTRSVNREGVVSGSGELQIGVEGETLDRPVTVSGTQTTTVFSDASDGATALVWQSLTTSGLGAGRGTLTYGNPANLTHVSVTSGK